MEAIVWRRTDLRESSRLLTFVSAERGRFVALAKGAHRKNSATLGRIDFLNRVDITLSGKGIALLGRVQLLHEPRALREPRRFLFASALVEWFERALPPDRPEPELFDLLTGSITLAERAPFARLPTVLAAVELRLLRALGLLAEFDRCARCGVALSDDATVHALCHEAGVVCPAHRGPGDPTLAPAVRSRMRSLLATRGRDLARLGDDQAQGAVLGILARWLAAGFERQSRLRASALAALAR
jgi:DNA repair protein RecO (recombination protein O)